MGATRDDFIKYSRAPHLSGSKGTDDDKHLGRKKSGAFIADSSLIVGETTDRLMEGLYVRTEAGGHVTGRAKMVRPEFVEKVKQSEHWQHQAMVPNQLAEGAEIWQ